MVADSLTVRLQLWLFTRSERQLRPQLGHSPFENAARRTNGGFGEAAARHQTGGPAAAMGRPQST